MTPAAERARAYVLETLRRLRVAGLSAAADELAHVLPALATFDEIERDVLRRELIRAGVAPFEASSAIRLALAPDLPALRAALVACAAALQIPVGPHPTNDDVHRLAKRFAFLRWRHGASPPIAAAFEALRVLAVALDCPDRVDQAIQAQEESCRRRGIGANT